MIRTVTLCLLLSATIAAAQLEAIRTLKPEEGQEVRRPIEAKVFETDQTDLPALETELLDIFKSSETTMEGKQYACRMLRFCASDASVPVLAPQLTSADLSSFVRLVLQGLDTPAAEKALIEALPKAGNMEIKAGIIGTLGQHRGSEESVKAIKPYLKNSNPDVQLAAITALGNIGGQAAAKALVKAKVKPELTDSWIQAQLKCAGTLDEENAEAAYRKFFQERYDEQIRAAALVALTALSPDRAADSVLTSLSSDNTCLKQTATGLLDYTPSDKLIGALSSLEPDLQVRVLGILAERKASEAEAAALTLAVDENETVRIAAYQTLAMVGGKPSIDLLIIKAPQDSEAFEALCAMQANSTDMMLIEQIKLTDDDKVKSRLLECLSQRKAAETLPLFVEQAKGDWSRSCKAAIDGMATLVSETDFTVYVELLTHSNDKKKTEAIEKSIATAAQRLPDTDACARPLIKAADHTQGDAKYALIRALGGIGGPEAKNLLIEASKNSDALLQDAAVRGLANWPSIDAAPELLIIATTSKNETHRVLALRGYIRLASSLNDYKTALDMCYKAADATDRPAELKAVISCAKKFQQQQVLDFLVLQLDNSEVYNEAAAAIFELAAHWRVKPHAGPALEKIAETAPDKEVAAKARAMAEAISQ